MIKICKECKKEFEARNNKMIYCDKEHYRICPICGKKFLVKRKQSLSIENLTCSKECAKKKELQTRENLEIKYPKNRKKRQGVKSNCKFCGKEIYKYNEKSRDYCPSHKMVCYVCGKEFDLKSRYLNENSIKENKFVCSQKCAAIKGAKNHNYKDTYDKASKTYFNKTGYTNPWSNPEIRTQINNTVKELYGDKFRSNISKKMWEDRTKEEKQKIFNKIKQTNLEKYGVDNVWKSKEIRDKCNNTCIEIYGKDIYHLALDKAIEKTRIKYGVDYYMQHPDFKEKSYKTLEEKYGPNFQSIISQKSKETRYKKNNGNYKGNEEVKKLISTNMKKYGVPHTYMHYIVNSKNNRTISKINRMFHHELTKIGIEAKYEQSIGGISYDLCIEDKKILIELDPTYSHQSTKERYFGGKPKPPIKPNYQQNRTLNAIKNKYHCIHVFDWDDWSKVINLINPSKEKIRGRKVELKEITKQQANEFLDKYHIQGKCKGNKVNLGLFYKNELVEVTTFGKPRYNNKYEWEWLRLATSDKYQVIGGVGKFWKYFQEKYQPNSIITYIDNSKFSIDNFLNNFEFRLVDYGQPSPHWYNIKTGKHFTNNLLLQLGADKLLGTNYGKPEVCGMNNKEVMIKEGFVEVYDCGQSTWAWNKL